jgi:murein hydrolase activator
MTDAARRTVSPRLLFVGVLVLALSSVTAPTWGQNTALDAVQQRDHELEALQAERKKAADTEKRLRDEADAIGEDRRRLNQTLIETAGRVRSVESRIGGTEIRLRQLADSDAEIRKSLDSRRGVIAEVLAALQRMGRRPPPAVLVKPEGALESIRTAMLLGAVLPDMRHEAEALVADLNDLVRVQRESLAERDGLTRDLAALSDEHSRLSALVTQRQTHQSDVEKALEAERQRAAQLSKQADNLKDLIAKLEQGLDKASRAARTALHATEQAKIETGPDRTTIKDPGRLTPAVAFASAKNLLPMPVNGVKIREFGAPDGLGGTERGVTVATRAGAQVTAPCDGWVVYAAPYRSYGQLLILNAGGGYHVVIAGMERISVDLGQFVLTGEPVAIMGNGPLVASTAATGLSGAGQPGLYIEFRKDGTPIDPTPWWATTDSEKVRG